MAFNVGAPHYYLDDDCVAACRERSGRRLPDYVLGRITRVATCAVLADPPTGSSGAAGGSRAHRRGGSSGSNGALGGTPSAGAHWHPRSVSPASSAASASGASGGAPSPAVGPEREPLAPAGMSERGLRGRTTSVGSSSSARDPAARAVPAAASASPPRGAGRDSDDAAVRLHFAPATATGGAGDAEAGGSPSGPGSTATRAGASEASQQLLPFHVAHRLGLPVGAVYHCVYVEPLQ
jgi:hypothetical protein